MEYENTPEESLISDAISYIDNSVRFMPETLAENRIEPGQRIKHMVFGEGTVIDIDEGKQAHIIKFDEIETPRQISFKAKLELI